MRKLLIYLDKCNGCRECEMACATEQKHHPAKEEAISELFDAEGKAF